jgi:hypothetical protein
MRSAPKGIGSQVVWRYANKNKYLHRGSGGSRRFMVIAFGPVVWRAGSVSDRALLPERNDLPFFQRPRIFAKDFFLRLTGYPQRVRWPMTWSLFSFWAPEPEAQDAFHFVGNARRTERDGRR